MLSVSPSFNRIKKEYCRIPNKYEPNLECKILLKIKNHQITIILNENYPFRSPKIYINNKPYIEFLASKFDMIEVKNISKYKRCLCCSSIACHNNWKCTSTIRDIIKEIRYMINLRNRITERQCCRIIQDEFNITIPIYEYL